MTITPQTATVSDEAVQAALDEYYPAFTPSESAHDDMRRALTAALPHLALTAAPCSVEVRKLEWVHHAGNYPTWSTIAYGYKALIDTGEASCFGAYPLFINGIWDKENHNTSEVAKAAAQADFDRRTLPQIATKPVDPWQDIATASKDGTEFLTWNGRRQHVARFDKVENAWVSSFTTVTKRLPLSPQPTHFAPLPAAPTSKGGE